jgi:Homeodomain-like domain
MAQTVCVIVSAVDRDRPQAIAADRNRRQKHVERARLVLASADRGSAQRVAQSLGVSRPTVWRWQQRFAEAGVEGLLRDGTRKPGKTPIAADQAARVVALTCTQPPHEATHWTGRDGQGGRHRAALGATVNAGEKMHWLAGVKMHHGRGQAGTTANSAFQFD